MAKCPRCKQRKSKRPCPALGYSICHLCCGQIRNKEIPCPPDCPHRQKHGAYQIKRSIEQNKGSLPPIDDRNDPLKNERLSWLILHIEAPLRQNIQENAEMKDMDLLPSLEYALEKIKRDKLFIISEVSEKRHPDVLGESIHEHIQKCRFQGNIIIPGASGGYSQEEKRLCLERIILTIRKLTKQNLNSRDYIRHLIDKFNRIHHLSHQGKILPS